MDEKVERAIRATGDINGLRNLQANIVSRGLLTDDVRQGLVQRAAEIAVGFLANEINRDPESLSPAERRIFDAVRVYNGLKWLEGTRAARTIDQIKNRGLLGAAEASVDRAKPSEGFDLLRSLGYPELTYEQIVLDHPEEFTKRALWRSRHVLGLPNILEKPPAKAETPVHEHTDALIEWLRNNRDATGRILPHTNTEAAEATAGWGDLSVFGRAFGNVQSRLDFACYRAGLPPLGLTAQKPFDDAWKQDGRKWEFPVQAMQASAQARRWSNADFDAISKAARDLPGSASVAWRGEEREDNLFVWAASFVVPGREASEQPEAPTEPDPDHEDQKRRNPPWTREELILALDLYLRHRNAPLQKGASAIGELSRFLVQMQAAQEDADPNTYRNEAGVYMKLMNLRRIDPNYAAQGQSGLSRGNSLEPIVWDEFAQHPEALARAVAAIREGVEFSANEDEAPSWVFVCNPRKWAIDRFLQEGRERDTWGIRPSDAERFAPGQLGIVRVGVDRRSLKELDGATRLEAGIYALCEVESAAFLATGASDEFWSEGAEREPGWPTVRIRYLHNYLAKPLTIERLKEEAPELSPLLLGGFQAASFPISAADFSRVLELLEVGEDDLANTPAEPAVEPDNLAALEEKYRRAAPQVKERVSRSVERGPIGAAVKRANGFKCQICEGLGRECVGFLKKPSGEPYVEAHHVMPVHRREVGSLAASNIMTVCANHHRQLHYGGVEVRIEAATFELEIEGRTLVIPRMDIRLSMTK